MGESWYLAADFQLFIMGPWIMMAIWKLGKILDWVFMAFLLAASIAVPGVLTAINDWPPQLFTTILDPTWFDQFYIRFYTRASPYIWGIIFGYIVFHTAHIDRKKGTKLPIVSFILAEHSVKSSRNLSFHFRLLLLVDGYFQLQRV